MFARKFAVISLIFCCLLSVSAQIDRRAEAEKLFAEAETLRQTRKADSMREAIKKYETLIPVFNELEMRKREADCFNNIGYIYKNLGEFERSLPFLEKSLQINRQIKNLKGQIISLLNLAQASRYLGEKENALGYVNEALTVSREAGDRELEAAALNELGIIHFNVGEIQKSHEYFAAAASIFEKLGKPLQQASLLNNLGRINRLLGFQEAALENYTKALEIFRSTDYKIGVADVCLNLSAVYKDLFRTAEAMEYFNKALEIFRKNGNRQREAVVLNNIGVFYNDLGDYSKALDFYTQSAEISENIGDRRQFSSALKNLGILYTNLGDYDQALDRLNLALQLSRNSSNRQNEGWILNNIGVVYDKKGDYEKARRFMQQALEILRAVGDRAGEANTLFNLGETASHLDEKEIALENYSQALEIRRELLTPIEDAKILLGIARLERELGNAVKARQTIEQAIEKIETLRTAIPGQELRTSFFSLEKDAYDFYIDLLLRTNDGSPSPENIARAFEISEQARARSLLESLIESRTEIRQGVDTALLNREKSLHNQLNARENYRLNLLQRKARPESLAIVEKEIRALITEYQQIRTEIRIKNPNYAALVQPQFLTLPEIQQSILDPETVLLEYALGEENSYLWVIARDSAVSYKLPKRLEIENAARNFYKSLNARSEIDRTETVKQRNKRLDAADREMDAASQTLAQMLIPFDLTRFSQKRLLIVAEGVLQYIPFAALKIQNSQAKPGFFLVEKNEIINLPSASTLAVLRKTNTREKNALNNSVAVLADPVFSPDDVRVKTLAKKSVTETDDSQKINDQAKLLPPKLRGDFSRLRFSRLEANAISSLVPENRKFVALDFAANRQSVISEKFMKARIIHFATHGVVRSEFPELSGIVLSLVDKDGDWQDGFLRLHDIYNLNLEADLVVLSACETALGKEIKGEGIVGLTRGFMYAGARGVVASLWKVDDKATADLMKRFYQSLLKEDLRPAAALRKAQISMIREKATRNPYYWAAFTLQGDWQ